jgi:Family of unknown function (DUF5684)
MNELSSSVFYAQVAPESNGAGVAFSGVLGLAVVIVVIAGLWKTFEKAGKPGWGAIIPIYNIILLLEIAGRPLWWFFLMLIPFVNVVVAIIVAIDVARNFGKGAGFGLGLALLSFIFYPILGFGDAQYQGVTRYSA